MAATTDAFAQAARHFTMGNLSMAEQYSWFVLSNAPNHADALRMLGLIAARNGDLDRAIDYLNRSLICDSASTDTWQHLREAHNNLGSALKAKGKLADAAQAFQSAVKLQPDNPDYVYNLGVTLRAEGDVEGAMAAYRQALDSQTTSAAAHYSLGNALKDSGDFAGAILCYRRAVAVNPNHALMHCNLGVAPYIPQNDRGYGEE